MKYLKHFESMKKEQFEKISFNQFLDFINSHIRIKMSDDDITSIQNLFKDPLKYSDMGYRVGEERNMRENDSLAYFIDLKRHSACFYSYKDKWYILEIQNATFSEDEYIKCDEIEGLLSAIIFYKKKYKWI